MDPGRIKGIPCFALVMCAEHLLRPLYFKILDPPPLSSFSDIDKHLKQFSDEKKKGARKKLRHLCLFAQQYLVILF